MRYGDLIGSDSTPYSTPPLERTAEAPPFELEPASKIRPWREEYEADLRAAEIEINKREEDHTTYLNDFLEQHGRLPTLQEDKFSEGLEMFTNRLIPAPQRGQKRQHGSEDGGKDDNEDVSEDYSEPDDGEIVDSSLDPDYEDC